MLLSVLGSRLRKRRKSLSWTQQELADKAGVSLRFLAQLEAGKGNISVQRLADICRELELSLSDVFRGVGTNGSLCLTLVGLRGAGKSTLGALLSEALAVPFVELDELIVSLADMSLAEIFSFGGEEFYHELNGRAIEQLLRGGESVILATGGSLVMHVENWNLLRRSTRTVWLQASPESHLHRVTLQGDLRPMSGHDNVLAELKHIFLQRKPYYAQAELHLSTDQAEPDELCGKLVQFYRSL
jgi:XRE family transcriptional regulator, aerobic/anaerobic benzoate catabolism transcriptional regulator